MLPRELDEEVKSFQEGYVSVAVVEHLQRTDMFFIDVTIREQGGTYIYRINATRRELDKFSNQRVLGDWVLDKDGTIKIYRGVELQAILSPETSKILLKKFKQIART